MRTCYPLFFISVEKIFAILVGAIGAFYCGLRGVEGFSRYKSSTVKERRGTAYIICFLVVYVLSDAVAGMLMTPGEFEDPIEKTATKFNIPRTCDGEKELAWYIFLITLFPALLGIRWGLPNPKKDKSEDEE